MTAAPAFVVSPFQGVSNGSVKIVAGAASLTTRVFLDPGQSTENPNLRQIRIANLSTTDDVFIAWGDSTITTTTLTGMAVPHGDVEVLTIGLATHLAVITGGAAVTLDVTPGGGV